MHTKFWSKKLKKEGTSETARAWKDKKRALRRLRVRGRTTIYQFLEKPGVRVWTDSSGSGQGAVAGCCEHGNEHSGFIIKEGNF
jgi:hypothetical protein